MNSAIKLRDVLFLTHAKPTSPEQAETWKKLIDGTLETADTWEVRLSASKGAEKGKIWKELIQENKLGALAFLRNLRNMQTEKVPMEIIREGIVKVNTERVLPFRFISAAKYCPDLEPELEQLMFSSLKDHDQLKGKTILLVDKSGSMDSNVSGKSELTRYDAGVALSILIREICSDPVIYTFNDSAKKVVPRRGFALRDAMGRTDGGTRVGDSMKQAMDQNPDATRIIVITDEQSSDRVPTKLGMKGYMINVANAQNGVGYKGDFTHINGWSESIVDFIQELEKGDTVDK